MDITSNTVANSVTSLVVGAITSLVVDLAPLVEGQVRASYTKGAAAQLLFLEQPGGGGHHQPGGGPGIADRGAGEGWLSRKSDAA